MAVPILKQGDILIATIQSVLTDEEFMQFQDDLAERVGALRARCVIIDVSAVDVLDSYATRALQVIASVVKLRGAKTAIVGIRPSVAFAMAQLGVQLEGVHTALDLEDGLTSLGLEPRRTDVGV